MQPVVHRRSQLACACCVCVCVCVRVAGGVCLGGWLTSPATARVSYCFCPSYIYLKNMGLSTLRATPQSTETPHLPSRVLGHNLGSGGPLLGLRPAIERTQRAQTNQPTPVA